MQLPRWHSCSNRCIYLNLHHEHSTIVPLVLGTFSVSIIPKFCIVFNDCFSTVTSSADSLPDTLPAFISNEWITLLGNSTYQYHTNESSDTHHTILQHLAPVPQQQFTSDVKFDSLQINILFQLLYIYQHRQFPT